MGIYDRDYYRKDGPSFLGTLGGRTRVCKWLIVINAGVFILQLLTRQQNNLGPITSWLQLDVQQVASGQIWRLLTYAFVHSPYMLWHVLFNMLFLWWFGSDVEDIYGPREFLAIYLVGAFLGGVACEAAWLMGMTGAVQVIGASGAVMTVLVLCALHYPTRVIYLFLFLPVPIWLCVVYMVGSDLLGMLGVFETQVAFAAHLGGAAFGFLYYKWQGRLLDLWPGLPAAREKRRARPQLRIYRDEETGEPVPVAAPPSQDSDEHLEAKVDAVLEKVAQFGQSSLTDSERQILLKASEVYRKRRS